MISTREHATHAGQGSDSLTERLRDFMRTHDLSREELAGLLRTAPQTLDHWFDGGDAPPACLLALMVLLGSTPKAQSRLGGHPNDAPPYGSAFRPGELSQEEELRRVRAI